MGHNISGLLLKGPYEPLRATQLGMPSVTLPFDLTLFFCEWRLAEYWSLLLEIPGELPIPDSVAPPYPRDRVLATLMQTITQQPEPRFAIIATDYFGGIGSQAAYVFQGEQRITPEGESSINAALARLGVVSKSRLDAFDTIGLDKIRSMREFPEVPDPDEPRPTTYPHTIPGVLPRLGFDGFFWLAANIPELSLQRLLSELPEHMAVTFYDPAFSSPTDPGAFVTVWQDESRAFWLKRANHGWHTNPEIVSEATLAELLVQSAPHHAPLNATAATLQVRLHP
ncbi:hypothetical protein [Armatimonas sp.]|uniref:hypothetical protein n=1 Tax=Armatimonas sp. TaxID=1872638 RepID=UPI00286ABD7B|nr:hypothetical protein [Armatimonas sp.]